MKFSILFLFTVLTFSVSSHASEVGPEIEKPQSEQEKTDKSILEKADLLIY